MSWSFTVNADRPMTRIPETLAADMARAHPLYPDDMQQALDLANKLGLPTFTCAGMRMPTPYNDDEVVDVSVRGMTKARKFNEAMREVVLSGPETGGDSTVFHEDDNR
jgi:hypothetical protein